MHIFPSKRRVAALLLLALSLAACKKQGAPDMSGLYPHEGTYEIAPGHRIAMGVSSDPASALFWLDLKTLQVGQLDAVSGTVFKDHQHPELKFEFSRNAQGATEAVKLSQGGVDTPARRVEPHTRETVTFNSGGRKLRGDLYLPAAPGKHPVVVFAHGSGAATRAVGPFTAFFLQLGIGVLAFDKQGAGESEGEWQTASFDALAADVSAGVDYVRSRPQADPARVGVMGSSQGGWIGSMVAAKRQDLAFLLVRVGSGQNVRDTMAHEKRGQYMAEGIVDPKDLGEGVALYHANWDVAARGGKWEEGQALFDAQAAKPWFIKAFGTERVKKSKETEQWWTWLGHNLKYDATDYLKTVTTPVLWTMAEQDWNVNSQASLPRLNAALAQAGNKDYTVKILPGGHTGLVVKTGLPNDAISWQYAPGYWDGMEAWLKARKIGR